MKDIKLPLYKHIIRILVGIIFSYSAVLKLISIDAFEVYVYSFGLFSLDITFLLSRLLISFELGLGIWLITGLYRKPAILLSATMLIGFSIFLVVLLMGDSEEHCHCFGEAIVFTHYESIAKNLVLLVLLAFVYKGAQYKFRFGILSLAVIALACTASPLIVSPPDTWMHDEYASKSTFNEQMLAEYIAEQNLTTGKHMLSFFGTGCRFCKLSAKKIEVIKQKSTNASLISYHFWGNDEGIQDFQDETFTEIPNYSIVEGGRFLKITDGKMPLIVLLENGKVVNKFGYRDFDEKAILEFLK